MNITSNAEKKVELCLKQLVRTGKVPGIQYVVVGPEGIRYEACFGVMDVLSGRPVTPETTFMASSVTKTLTAAAILQLHDRHLLDINNSLSSYYSEQPFGDEVLIVQLLNQSSGVPNPMPLRWLHLVSNHDGFDEDDALQRVLARHAALRFKPGTRYAYSNLSYWLLGKVIERVSGVEYEKYMREHIFDRLGMSRESIAFVIPDKDHHACGHLKKWSAMGVLMPLMTDKDIYDKPASGRRRFKAVYMNGPAYGGMVGTARAFSLFLHDQLTKNTVLFSDAAKALYFSHQTDASGQAMETTLGWHLGSAGGIKFYGKPGGGPGYQSNIRIYPDKKIATVWLANETAVSESTIHALTNKFDSCFL